MPPASTSSAAPTETEADGKARSSKVRPYHQPTGSHGELVVGFGPTDEPVPELAKFTSPFANWQKCRAFISQLKRQLGPPPRGGDLFIRQHDYPEGTLFSVHLRYRGATPSARDAVTDYVIRLQRDCPKQWDAIARKELDLDATSLDNGDAAKASDTSPVDLTPRQLEILKKVYVAIGRTSDQLLLSPTEAERLRHLFIRRSRKEVAASRLIARIILERKRGGWPCLRNGDPPPAAAKAKPVPAASAKRAKRAKRAKGSKGSKGSNVKQPKAA